MLGAIATERTVPAVVDIIVRAEEEAFIRLEIVNDVPLWEPFPGYLHQSYADEVRSSIRPLTREDASEPPCECHHVADVLIRFPDGSLKRPDISIFCRRPPRRDDAVTMVPVAVVEILSVGYEEKDLTFGLPFYLSQGVRDVIVADPRTGRVIHAHGTVRRNLVAPVRIELLAGCAVTIPEPVEPDTTVEPEGTGPS